MSESIPPLPSTENSAPIHKDRSLGLVVFGILTVLLGCLTGLFIILMLFGQAATARATQTPTDYVVILPAILIYGVLTVALIWLGIGSIQARRWARALLLIFSWSWLVIGIFMVVAMAFILPKVLGNLAATGSAKQPAMPPAAVNSMLVVMFLIFSFMFVLLPAIWVFFYGSRHVKSTCEARDITIRWTDACPLPVLGLCLWLLLSVPMLLLMPLMGHAVMPFFGTFLTRVPGTLFCLAVAVVWSYAAWLIYRLKPQGWWLIMVAMIVFVASSLVTFARHDILEMYQLMGYPQAQIDQIQKTGLLTGNRMLWVTGFSIMPFLAYLCAVRRYFRGKT